jgi:hypothetical protein
MSEKKRFNRIINKLERNPDCHLNTDDSDFMSEYSTRMYDSLTDREYNVMCDAGWIEMDSESEYSDTDNESNDNEYSSDSDSEDSDSDSDSEDSEELKYYIKEKLERISKTVEKTYRMLRNRK